MTDKEQLYHFRNIQGMSDREQYQYLKSIEPTRTEQAKQMAGNVIDTGLQGLQTTGESIRGLAAGGFDATAGLVELATAGAENIYDLGSFLTREAGNYLQDEPVFQEPIERTTRFSDKVREQKEAVTDFIRADDQGVAGRYSERIGEWGVPTGIATKAGIAYGQKIIEAGTKNPGFLKKMFISVAENPKLSYKLEQEVSAAMAIVSQYADDQKWDQWKKTLGELATGLSYGGAKNIAKRLYGYGSGLVKKEASTAHKMAQDYLYTQDQAMGGKLVEKIDEGKKLATEYDIPIEDTAHLSGNEELKEALRVLQGAGSTSERTRIASQTAALRAHKAKSPEDIGIGIAEARTAQEKTIRASEKALAKTKQAAEREVTLVTATNTPTEVGTTSRIVLDTSEEVANRGVKDLYGKVGWDTPTGNAIIAQGIRDAKKTKLPGNEWRGELDAHLRKIFDRLQGRTGEQPKTYGTKKPFKLGQAELKLPELTLASVHELQGLLKDSMREAKTAGKKQLHRTLSKVLTSTYDELDNVGGISAMKLSYLKAANAKAKDVADRFRDARVNVLTRVDAQGETRLPDEDVVNQLVRANSAQGRETVVDSFMDAVEDQKLSMQILDKAFKAKLANMPGLIKNGVIDTKAVDRHIARHSDFLKKTGLQKKYKDPSLKTKVYEETLRVHDELVKREGQNAVAKWFDADDPVDYVIKEVVAGRGKKLMASAKGNKKIMRGIRESLWQGLMRRTVSGTGTAESTATYSANTVRKLLDDDITRKNITEVLGGKHTHNLDGLIKVMDRINLKGAKTQHDVFKQMSDKLVEQYMTGLRAAAHGFVRPDIIILQGAFRLRKNATLQQSKAILKDALENPEMAAKLLAMSRSRQGEAIVSHIFAPYINTMVEQEPEFND